ncbi:MAG: antibiotic biosynthesis monooxygenase, partial [Parvibaculum sp.]|uniref:putative quinol monooxygenase n=1 Tax=Parvibaculum sp. TaxID=2024848 RepID=UPI003C70A2DD
VHANEKGCLQYDFFKSKADASTYIIMEQYATQADLDAHGKSDYFKAAGAKFGSLLGGAPGLVFSDKIG